MTTDTQNTKTCCAICEQVVCLGHTGIPKYLLGRKILRTVKELAAEAAERRIKYKTTE